MPGQEQRYSRGRESTTGEHSEEFRDWLAEHGALPTEVNDGPEYEHEPPEEGIFQLVPERIITDPAELPEMPPDIIEGLLRVGEKAVLTGPSKAGKSWALIELAAAIATGGTWLGRKCTEGRVLYINLELTPESCLRRICRVCKQLGADLDKAEDNFQVLNLRGMFTEIAKLRKSLELSLLAGRYDLIIVDPAYKVQSGSENDAKDITAFAAELDKLAGNMGCAVFYCHHHPKGDQSARDVKDKASGSGVFVRDIDLQVDLSPLSSSKWSPESWTPTDGRNPAEFHLEAFAVGHVVRDRPKPPTVGVWFICPKDEDSEYCPIHEVDRRGDLVSGGADDVIEAAKIDRDLVQLMHNRTEMMLAEYKQFLGITDNRPAKEKVAKSSLFEAVTVNNNRVVIRWKQDREEPPAFDFQA